MFKRILVPVDGSRTAGFGLEEAIKLARQQGAELCVLHVVDNRALLNELGINAAETGKFFESLHTAGEQLLAKAVALASRRQVRTKSILAETSSRSVADVIIRNARKWRADLIVLGTHGRRGLSRLMMGSDAEGVVREAAVPVLLVRSKPRKTS